MKKLTALLLSLALVLGLAACGNGDRPTATQSPTATASAENDSSIQPEGGKVLVAYYSASGNTERVAQDIADATGGDLFEIVPIEVYSEEDLDWTNSDSRVSREHEDESLRDVALTTTEVSNWDEYDTVFIGYPIWWGIAAWPVDGFVQALSLIHI